MTTSELLGTCPRSNAQIQNQSEFGAIQALGKVKKDLFEVTQSESRCSKNVGCTPEIQRMRTETDNVILSIKHGYISLSKLFIKGKWQ